MAVGGMILAGSPGNEHSPAWMRHSPWHGCTPVDLIFPAFLFIMGVSLAISLGRRIHRGEAPTRLAGHVLWRTAVIGGLGLAGAWLVGWATDSPMRVPGVLQRIAVCYLLGSLLFIWTTPLAQGLWAAGLLLGYSALLAWVPGPGGGGEALAPWGNLPSAVDRALLGPQHLLDRAYDPDGILSTLGAMANVLAGALAGQWLRSPRPRRDKALGLARMGAALAAAGGLWGLWLPINKPLWTGSFAALTTGVSLLGLAGCAWLIEIRRADAWARPFEVFGRNPLASFIFSSMAFGLLEFIPAGGGSLKEALCRWAFESWLPAGWASAAFAAAFCAACLGLMTAAHRRKLFLRI